MAPTGPGESDLSRASVHPRAPVAGGPGTCKTHPTQHALGACTQCRKAVCAMCSTRSVAGRLCHDCKAPLVAERKLRVGAEGNLRTLGFTFVAFATVLLSATAWLYRMMPEDGDILAGFVVGGGLWILTLGLMLVTRRGHHLLVSVLVLPLLFSIPVGTLFGALVLYQLYGRRGAGLFGASYRQLREATPELDPRMHKLASGGLLVVVGLSVAANLMMTIRTPKPGTLEPVSPGKHPPRATR